MGINTPELDRRQMLEQRLDEREQRLDEREQRLDEREQRLDEREQRLETDITRRQEQAATARKAKQSKTQPSIKDRRHDRAMRLQALLKQQPNHRMTKGKCQDMLASKTPDGIAASYWTVKGDVEAIIEQYDIFQTEVSSPGMRADYNKKREAPKIKKPVTYVSLTAKGLE
ncbi:MAG: hypothetical protein OXU36_13150 [Candidatus Poribacteria bacterium]|nr:hypothetical protein [Candidatus Poribacteria bacterium]